MDWLKRTWSNIVSIVFALLAGAGGMYVWQQGQFDKLENKIELLAGQQRTEFSERFTDLNNRFTALDTRASGQMNGMQSTQNELLVASGVIKTELTNIKDQLGRVAKKLDVASLDTQAPMERNSRNPSGATSGSTSSSDPTTPGQREPADYQQFPRTRDPAVNSTRPQEQ